MSSKYIPKKGGKPFKALWWSTPPQPIEKFKYVNPLASEKKRIENIPLEDVSFEEIYSFPLHSAKYGSWVYDSKGHFVFQFEINDKDTREKALSVINGELKPSKENEFRNDEGMIQVKIDDKWLDFILIRGWGNLTGTGAYNLNGEHAAKIQDTFADFIVEKLAGIK